jgi:hemoglobin
MLDHHPYLQKTIKKGLARAKREKNVKQRAWALREVILEVRSGLGGSDYMPPREKVKRSKPNTPTLWDRLGGQEKVEAIVDDLIEEAIADPKINFTRNGTYKMNRKQRDQLKQQFVRLASDICRGPLPRYRGKSMKEAHQGMGITDDEFDAFVGLLKRTLLRHEIDTEVVEVLERFMEGTRKSIVPNHKPQPRPAETLFDRLGGTKNVERIVDDLIEAAIKDPKVNFFRNGHYKMNREQLARLKRKFVLLASDIGRGPLPRYDGKTMKAAHPKDMQITNEEFDAFLGHMEKALRKNNVEEKVIKLLLKTVEITRPAIVTSKKSPAPKDKMPLGTTLWQRMGREKGVQKIVDDFVTTAMRDPAVNVSRNGKLKLSEDQLDQVKNHLVDMTSMLGKGPRKYNGPTLKEVFKGMGVTSAEFNAAVRNLKKVLNKTKYRLRPKDVNFIVEHVESKRSDIVTGKSSGGKQTRLKAKPATDSESGGDLILQMFTALSDILAKR